MKNYLSISLVFTLICYLSISCNQKQDSLTNENTKVHKEVVIDIDSNSLKINKKDVKNFIVSKDDTPASKEEINEMVSREKVGSLNKNQQVVQFFFKACSAKDYVAASKLMVYNGKDINRKGKDSYDANNPSELSIVKATVDVIYGFLEESKDYEFISFEEKTTKKGKVFINEVSFFKKGIGINRRFFEVIDTPKGKLISEMR